MSDVLQVSTENATLRKIQNKLLQWESMDNSLAPLNKIQENIIYRLSKNETIKSEKSVSSEHSNLFIK